MKILTFTVRIRAEFYDSDQIGPKQAAILLCQDINKILTLYDGSTGSAQIVRRPANIKVTGSKARIGPGMKRPNRSKRRCRMCRQPERVRSIGGIRFSNITQHLGLCAQCINNSLKA
jgi:hypothetical protein